MYIEGKKLAFFHELISLNGWRKKDLAQKMGMLYSRLMVILKTDDMTVKNAMYYMDKLGYIISFRIQKKGDDLKSTIETVQREVINNRLTFLKVAMQRYNLSCEDMAKACGIQIPAVYRWFRKEVDDIKISHLYTIAQNFDLEVVVEYKRIVSVE